MMKAITLTYWNKFVREDVYELDFLWKNIDNTDQLLPKIQMISYFFIKYIENDIFYKFLAYFNLEYDQAKVKILGEREY